MSSSDSSFSVGENVSFVSRDLRRLDCVRLTLLLLLLGSWGSSVTASSGSSATSSWSGGSTTAGADVGQDLLDVLALEGLGEELGPDGLDVRDLGGGDEGLELVGLEVWNVRFLRSWERRGGGASYGDLNTLVGEDERRVGGGELGGGHFCGVG